ncbi:MAG: class I SAM-dependent methyltransferase [Terriglobales bacterium]
MTLFRGYLLFWSQWRRRFTDTGAIAPSSPQLGRALTAFLAERRGGPLRVLEVGAGTGAVTRQAVARLRSGDQFDVCEINPEFCGYLADVLRAWAPQGAGPQVRLLQSDVRAIEASEGGYDRIICGLPFNNFAPEQVRGLFAHLLGLLAPGGVLSYFEYTWLRQLRIRLLGPGPERERLRAITEISRRLWAGHEFDSTAVWWNLPPATAHHLHA